NTGANELARSTSPISGFRSPREPYVRGRSEIGSSGRRKPLPPNIPGKPPSRAANTDPPVNFAKLSTGQNGDFEAESLAPNTDPCGFVLDPGDPLLRMETGDAPNTCEIFGIWGTPKCARVKLNHCAAGPTR